MQHGNAPPLVSDILSKVLLHSSPHINHRLRHITRNVLHFCPVDSLLNYAPDFVVKRVEEKNCSVATNLEVCMGDHDLLRLLHFLSGGREWCTDCLGKHSMRQKIIARRVYQMRSCAIATYITKSLQTSGKLIFLLICSRLYKIQLVTINVLIR